MTKRILSHAKCVEANRWMFTTLIAKEWAGVKQKITLKTYKHFAEIVTLPTEIKNNIRTF